jgi:hypothetical protein
MAAQEDQADWWLYGVNPGAIAAHGSSLDDAHQDFRDGLQAVLFQFAAEASSFEAFKTEVERFFYATDEPTAAEWNDAVQLLEIVRGLRCPADTHQSRYRRSMRAATSSCSISLPARAAARPFSTSARNHSSWSMELVKRSMATSSTVRPVSTAMRASLASSSGGIGTFMRAA